MEAPRIARHYGGIALVAIREAPCYRRGVTRPVKVLVIDDDPGIRQMLALALGEAGFEVAVSDGHRVEDGAQTDVVLLDVRLGNWNARQLLDQVPSLTAKPIIVMTATVAPDEAARGLAGVAAIVRKPFDLDVMERTIREVVATVAPREG